MTLARPLKHRLRWSLHIETRELPDGHVVSVTGRLGSTTAATLKGALDPALDAALASGHRRVVLNLAGVDYLSSAGLAVLERADDRLRAGGGALVLAGLQEAVRVSFEVSGAGSRFEWVDQAP